MAAMLAVFVALVQPPIIWLYCILAVVGFLILAHFAWDDVCTNLPRLQTARLEVRKDVLAIDACLQAFHRGSDWPIAEEDLLATLAVLGRTAGWVSDLNVYVLRIGAHCVGGVAYSVHLVIGSGWHHVHEFVQVLLARQMRVVSVTVPRNEPPIIANVWIEETNCPRHAHPGLLTDGLRNRSA
jgi:hypothetical protein